MTEWVDDPSANRKADNIMESLGTMSKTELLTLLRDILRRHPHLVDELAVAGLDDNLVQLRAFTQRIEGLIDGDLSYYAIGGVVGQLESLKKEVDYIAQQGNWAQACEIYLALMEGGITACDDGADDSDGEIGTFVGDCNKAFADCAAQIQDPGAKDQLLEKALPLVTEEDYGLDTQVILLSLVTPENISKVETYLRDRLKPAQGDVSNFHVSYHKRAARELLMALYDNIGQPAEKLRLARTNLATKDDFAGLARALLGEGFLEDALAAAAKGLDKPGDSHLALEMLYFSIAQQVMSRDPALVDFSTALKAAREAIGRRFDAQNYHAMAGVFRAIGKYPEFKADLVEHLQNRNVIAEIFLHDGDLEAAISLARDTPGIRFDVILNVATAALAGGLTDAAGHLTALLLERKWVGVRYGSTQLKPLAANLVHVSDDHLLEVLCAQLAQAQPPDALMLLLPYIAEKSPLLAGALAKKIILAVTPELVAEIATKTATTSPPAAIALCRKKLSPDFLRSRNNYGKVADLLVVARDVFALDGNDLGWDKFLRCFVSEHHGKKKLLALLRSNFPTAGF